ncbi:MAG TPA: translocation/assembly module TamB domain-containing protein, partial [Rhodothermales bacterium]
MGGYLTADIGVSGTFESPILDGTLSLSNGRIRLPEYNVTYRDLNVNATLAENRLEFTNARMASGDGTLTADGTVSLTELTLGEFDINARLDEFLAVRNSEYRATISGDLHLAGTTSMPEISGDVRIISADIYLDEATGTEIVEVELTDRDVRMLEERFGYTVTQADTAVSVFYENLTLDITVEMERDTWIRQQGTPEMAIQFEGELDVQKQPGSDPQIFGTIEVLDERSYIDQFSRRFNINAGTITFNGTPENFYMDVSAEYEVKSRSNPGQPEVTIILGLRGRLDDLEFTLNSNPQMQETDILSYIATGQPAGQTLQLGDASDLFVSGGAGLALNEVAGVLEGIAGEGLGLDVIEIQHDGLRGAVLIAGKYVSPRVYVGVSQPVTFNSSVVNETLLGGNQAKTELTMEYEVFKWLLLKLSGGRSSLRGNLLWEYAY